MTTFNCPNCRRRELPPFYRTMLDLAGMEWWTAAEAVRLAAPQLPFLLGSKDPDGASKSLGKYLSTEVDRVNEGFILEAWRDRKRATYWRVKVVATP